MFTPDNFKFINILFENSYILLVSLLVLSIASFGIAIYLHKQKKSFIASIFIGLFLSFLQIIITVFIIEKIFEHYQERQWRTTTQLISNMFTNEVKGDLIDIIYMIDFTEYRLPHNYLDRHFESKMSLSIYDAIYASNKFLNSVKLENYADHKLYKKGDSFIDYQISVFNEFILKMESNLKDIERIIDLAQINIQSQSYNDILECRNNYRDLIQNSKLYVQFLGVSEITGKLIDYNLKFEKKYKEDMYNGLINSINYMQSILIKKNN
jgi:hypothetical protein